MTTEQKVQPGLGSGIYTYSEAGRVLCVGTQQVRRWAEGYVYKLNGEDVHVETEEPRDLTRPGLLTFYDLIELNFVKEFMRVGVRLQHVIDTAIELRQRWQTPYPFAYEELKTDGPQLLLPAGEDYENVAQRQQVFRFTEELFKNIEFENHMARRWWPLGPGKLILIDPHRSFGAPIDAVHGIRTETLYKAYLAEDKDTRAVADWYEVNEETVKAAVEFEEQCLSKAA